MHVQTEIARALLASWIMDIPKNLHVRVSVRLRPFSAKEIESKEQPGWKSCDNLIQQAGQTTGIRFDNGNAGTQKSFSDCNIVNLLFTVVSVR